MCRVVHFGGLIPSAAVSLSSPSSGMRDEFGTGPLSDRQLKRAGDPAE